MSKVELNRDNQPIESVLDLVETAGQMQASTVVVAGGDRMEDLRLVESARDHGIIDRIILVGNRRGIEASIEEVGIEIHPDDIVAAGHGEKTDYEQVAAATVEVIQSRQVDIVLKGNMSTPILNRRMLPLAVRPTVSLVTVFDAAPIAAGRMLLMTDAGFTTVCNLGRMVDLIENAADVARTVLGLRRPRIAVLSANEKPVLSLPSTWIGRALAERTWRDAVVCGPLSFDLATDPGSVEVKGLPDLPNAAEVAGCADVLVCPGIDAANVLYKNLTAMNKFGQASLASLTMGFSLPYIIISRADTMETRLVSIALSSIYAQRTTRAPAATRTSVPVSKPSPPTPMAAETQAALRVLCINPGSTQLRMAILQNGEALWEGQFDYPDDLPAEPGKRRQFVQRLGGRIVERIRDMEDGVVDAVSTRGGFLPTTPDERLGAGVYAIADLDSGLLAIHPEIVRASLEEATMDHPSNLGIPLAATIAEHLGVPAYTVDPVIADDFCEEARYTGLAGVERRPVAHNLSLRAAARKAAQAAGRPLEQMNLVAAHLGAGVTVAAIRGGRIVDANIALLGDGPFTPRRVGRLPLSTMLDLCFSGRHSREELVELFTQRGGLTAYLKTDDLPEIENEIVQGSPEAVQALDAMIYHIAKEIGAAFAALSCEAECIVLTGRLAQSARLVKALRSRIQRLAPVQVFAEPLEMVALAEGAVDVLAGHVRPIRYSPPETPDRSRL